MGCGAERRRRLCEPRSALLAAPVAPRYRAAVAEEQRQDPRHLFVALAGAAESDRHLDRQAGRRRRRHRAGARPRLPRRYAAARHQAVPLRIHAIGTAAARRLPDRVKRRYPYRMWIGVRCLTADGKVACYRPISTRCATLAAEYSFYSTFSAQW